MGRDVRRAMLAAVPDAEPHDWLYRLVRSYPSRPGKAIRPALCLATCRAFGDATRTPGCRRGHRDAAQRVPGARRHRRRERAPAGTSDPAAEHGPGLALNAGDALAVLAHQVLRQHARRLDDDLGERLLDEFDTMALRTLEGQATELGWRRDAVRGWRPRTTSTSSCTRRAGTRPSTPCAWGRCWDRAGGPTSDPWCGSVPPGPAFQIQDDLLNLVGDEALYGKEINGDLREGKRTLVLIHLIGAAEGSDRRHRRPIPPPRTH